MQYIVKVLSERRVHWRYCCYPHQLLEKRRKRQVVICTKKQLYCAENWLMRCLRLPGAKWAPGCDFTEEGWQKRKQCTHGIHHSGAKLAYFVIGNHSRKRTLYKRCRMESWFRNLMSIWVDASVYFSEWENRPILRQNGGYWNPPTHWDMEREAYSCR